MNRRPSPAQLLTFAELGREQHFTHAAERLGLTQPAVTQHVRQLERIFGVRLVDIVGRRARLTEAGQFLSQRCMRLAENIAALEREMGEYAAVEIGEVRLGATVTIGSYGLAAQIAAFRTAHPRVALYVTVQNTERIGAAVLRGALSFALVEGELDNPILEITPYADDVLVVAVPRYHRLAGTRRQVLASDLADENFVAREVGSGTRAQFEQAFRALGVVPRVVLELPTGEGIVQAVEAGIGIGVVSALVTRDHVAQGRIRTIRVSDADLRRTFQFVRRRDLTPSPAARIFAEIVLGGSRSRS